MFNISSFLEKFKSREIIEIRRRSIVLDVVKKETGIEIKDTDIVFSSGRIRLNVSPIQKNQIFMKKISILEAINKEMSPTKIEDLF